MVLQVKDKSGRKTKKDIKNHRRKGVALLLFGTENGILCLAVCAMRIGSCAILRCEPCQVLTEAAVSACEDVLQGCPV